MGRALRFNLKATEVPVWEDKVLEMKVVDAQQCTWLNATELLPEKYSG